MTVDEDDKFAEVLVRNGVLTPEQLSDVHKLRKHRDEPLARLLIQEGLASTRDVFTALADYLNLPFIELQDYDIDPEVINIVPRDLAYRYRVCPVFKIENNLTLAMSNPGDVEAIDAVRRESGLEIEPAISLESDILAALEAHYGGAETLDASFDEVIQHIEDEKAQQQEPTSADKLKQLSAEAPVVKLVNLIITQAILERASDIHIEPEERSLRVRYRIDGVLHEALSPPKHLQAAIISRIKILSDLDIAESRVPQDGRFQVSLHGREIDLRVSTLPTVFGENVVLRILDKSHLLFGLEDLGLRDQSLQHFRRVLSSPYGIFLVSGPTGSGKTTTLYAALQSINSPEKNIVTVEDPVEYRLKMVRQSQVNPKAGLSFASGLRAILRQDPDVIMVGEIRDRETARVAVEAALTGHLVLSTIHTNDAPGGLTRLTEMGVEPFLTASAATAVVAQRLVRRICEPCKTPYEPSPALLNDLGTGGTNPDRPFYRGSGCSTCRHTGYRGRTGLYEIMLIDDEIRRLILARASTEQIRHMALKHGMQSLRHDGLNKALDGITTLEEVYRVTNPD